MNVRFGGIKNQLGDTMVEVMMSMAILAVILATAYATSSHSLQGGLNAQYRDQALSYAKQQLELIKNADNTSAQAIGGFKVGQPFCIDPSTTQLHSVDSSTKTCPLPVGSSGSSQSQYSIVDSYNSSNKTFAATVQWPSTNANVPNQLTIYYKPHDSFVTTPSSFPPPTSPTQTAPPSVGLSFSGSPTSVAYGGSSTLVWSSTNAVKCVATQNGTGGWNGNKTLSGSENTGPLTATTTFNLTCTGYDGSTVSKNVSVTVAPPPNPTLSFSASPTSISYGGATTLSWSTTNATSCSASGGWSGAKATSGSQQISGITSNQTYYMTCSGQSGSTPANGSASVTVSYPPSISYFYPWPEQYIYTSQGVYRAIYWSSSNTTSCYLSNYGWVGPSGGVGITAYPWQWWTLTCYNAAGASTQRSFQFYYYGSYAVLYQHASFDPNWPGWSRGYGEGAYGTPGDTSSLWTQGHVAFYDRQGNCHDFSPGTTSAFYGFVSWYGMPNDDDSWIYVGHNCSGY